MKAIEITKLPTAALREAFGRIWKRNHRKTRPDGISQEALRWAEDPETLTKMIETSKKRAKTN